MRRDLRIYTPIILLLVALGLPSRTIPEQLPDWYVHYAGDFLWAMLIFFLFCVVLRLSNRAAFFSALTTSNIVEISQLFHPPWLEDLRSIKLLALMLGYGFLWSDLLAYTLGILMAALIDRCLVWRFDAEES